MAALDRPPRRPQRPAHDRLRRVAALHHPAYRLIADGAMEVEDTRPTTVLRSVARPFRRLPVSLLRRLAVGTVYRYTSAHVSY